MVPSIAQLVERRTVVGKCADILRSLVRIRFEGLFLCMKLRLEKVLGLAVTSKLGDYNRSYQTIKISLIFLESKSNAIEYLRCYQKDI